MLHMAKGQRLKPEQIVTLLHQIDVLTTNGKTLAQSCKEVGTVEQSYYRWRKIYGGMWTAVNLGPLPKGVFS